jgi:hypothetical protein
MQITNGQHALTQWVVKNPALWKWLAQAESKMLKPDLATIDIEKPIYIAGLARSGSTILLEILASQPGVATHRYGDFPFVFTPYLWHRVSKRKKAGAPQERAHGDGIMITEQSPEAMEEMLWMAFFPGTHDVHRSDVLDEDTYNPPFASFYPAHIKKMLHTHKASRYVAKGNYHLTRLGYLKRLLPDARFVIPVREPAGHIGSLMRQHERFTSAGNADPRVTARLAAMGHFEFGKDRRPIHTGDDARQEEILNAWNSGQEVRGWALYWDALHRFLHAQLEANPELKSQCLVVRYEDLCTKPADTIRAVLSHGGFPDSGTAEVWKNRIRAPDYYESSLSDADRALIKELTKETAAKFGY